MNKKCITIYLGFTRHSQYIASQLIISIGLEKEKKKDKYGKDETI